MSTSQLVDRQKKFYDSTHPAYLEYQRNVPYARYLVGKMLEVIPGKRDKVLEIGAGQGRFTLELSRYVGKLLATDISASELSRLSRVAKQAGRKNIQTQVWDLLDDQAALSQVFDQIVGFFILHHLPRQKLSRVVTRLKRLLQPEGSLTFIEPNNLYPFHLVEIAITADMHWEIEKGIYTNYLGCFQKACREADLTRIVWQKFGFIPPPLINYYPFLTHLDSLMERLPLGNQLLCPFILLSFANPRLPDLSVVKTRLNK